MKKENINKKYFKFKKKKKQFKKVLEDKTGKEKDSKEFVEENQELENLLYSNLAIPSLKMKMLNRDKSSHNAQRENTDVIKDDENSLIESESEGVSREENVDEMSEENDNQLGKKSESKEHI